MLLVGLFAMALILKASCENAVDVVKYEGIGCYTDDNINRPLPILLKNFRDTIHWKNEWPSFDRIILECAKLAHTKGYLYFGIQFYGECWTGDDAYKTFDSQGESTGCIHGVGKERANFVYMITQDRQECSKDVYHTLKESGRSLYTMASGGNFKCDDTLMSAVPRWFRFTEGAGNSLAMKAAYTKYCSTLSGGWMVGSLPKDKNAPVTRKVCFPTVYYTSTKGNDCDQKWGVINIAVRNCGHFFVYKLKKPPNCPFRYCGDTISIKDY